MSCPRSGFALLRLLMWALLLAPVRTQLLAMVSEEKMACSPDFHFTCTNGTCVPKSWRCDGSSDCPDDSDEIGCGCRALHVECADGDGCVRGDDVCDGVRDCTDGSDEEALCALACADSDTALFRCASGDQCVAARRRCDGVTQCADGADERGCGPDFDSAELPCALRCGDHGETCVPEALLCDGNADCPDGADEAECGGDGARWRGGDPETPLRAADLDPPSTCAVADFPCSSGECVPEIQHCDGQRDCHDGSDESDCFAAPPSSVCRHGERVCGLVGPECVSLARWCDGEIDCVDGSDEEASYSRTCDPWCEQQCGEVRRKCRDTEWLCENGRLCVPLSWRCDGEADCPDHSDERLCDASVGLGPEWCRLSEFPCADGGCVPWTAACNGTEDCGDGSDEGERCGAADAACRDLGCAHQCHATPVGPVCVCPRGLRLGETGRNCVDRDECVELAVPPCAQRCLNHEGGFNCACTTGYAPGPSGTCQAQDPGAMLLYASLGIVAAVDLTTDHQVVLAWLVRSVLSLDFDGVSGKVYWYERLDKRISWALVNGTENGTLYTGITAEAIAVDWIARNIYWTDSESNSILAARLEAENEVAAPVVIVGSNVDDLHSLVLQPTDGLLYWTEWGEAPRISRSAMDGSTRKVLLSDGLGWPDALALDLPSRHLYWIDARLDTVECLGLDDARRMVVTTADVHGPFSLVVFEDSLYWSNFDAGKLETANKRTGRSRQTLFTHEHEIFALKMMHPLLQPAQPNPCASARCSHRCVVGAGATAACACPPGTLLGEDGNTCEPTGALPFLLLVSSTAVTQVFVKKQQDEGALGAHMQGLRLGHFLGAATRVAYAHDHRRLFYTSEEATASGSAQMVLLHRNGGDPAFQSLVMVQAVRDVAVDWSGGNLYWLSATRPTVEATRLDALSTRAVVILVDKLAHPASLALSPSSGDMCLSDWGRTRGGTGSGGARIECAHMDGTERRSLLTLKRPARPDSLVIDSNRSLLLWADEELGMIQSVRLDGSDYKILHRGFHRIAGLAVVDSALFWVVNKERSGELWRDGAGDVTLVALRARMLDVVARGALHPADNLACQQQRCEHVCLVKSASTAVCACPPDLAVEPNGGTACVQPSRCKEPTQRRCQDGGCVRARLWCDSVHDCGDGSDEANCTEPVADVNALVVETSLVKGTTTPQHMGAFEPDLPESVTWTDAVPTIHADHVVRDFKPSLPAAVETTKTSTTTVPQPDTLVASAAKTTAAGGETPFVMPSCSDDYCSGRGSCAEEEGGQPVCTCRWGYRGPHCQFFVIQAVGVKAALGCATVIGTLVIALMIGVAIHKRRQRRRLERHAPEQATVTFTVEPKESPAQEMSLIGERRRDSLSPSATEQGQNSTEVV